ncbi:MAG TPA: hypothetical protein VKC35_00890 [Vicinamibacterales bacterium]|nr:hypothetical protein [Vicinamibacterales bacterium]
MVRFITSLFVALALAASALPADAQGRGRGIGRLGAATPGLTRGYQEPAFARGYDDGFRHAQDDRNDRRRYDPVGHRDYREADQGFYQSYGSRDAYRDNYRAGFRAGYDAGYRDGNGRRR